MKSFKKILSRKVKGGLSATTPVPAKGDPKVRSGYPASLQSHRLALPQGRHGFDSHYFVIWEIERCDLCAKRLSEGVERGQRARLHVKCVCSCALASKCTAK